MKKIKYLIVGFMFLIGVGLMSQPLVILNCDNLDRDTLFIGDTISMSGEQFWIDCDGGLLTAPISSDVQIVNGCGSNSVIYIYCVILSCNSDWISAGLPPIYKRKEFTLVDPTDTITTSIKESESLDFGMYPNPTSDFVTIKVKNRSNYDVFSMSGQLMMTSMLNSGSNSIDLTNLPTGVYSVRIDGVTKQLIRL